MAFRKFSPSYGDLQPDLDAEVLVDLLAGDHLLRMDLVHDEYRAIGGAAVLRHDLQAGVEQSQGRNVGRQDERDDVGGSR